MDVAYLDLLFKIVLKWIFPANSLDPFLKKDEDQENLINNCNSKNDIYS